jgi:hypothetical protein
VPIEAAIFLSSPGLVVAPFLEIGLAALGQIFSPCRSAPVSLLTRIAARIKPAMPLSRLSSVRDARSLDDHTDEDAGIVDVPGFRAIIDALAG